MLESDIMESQNGPMTSVSFTRIQCLTNLYRGVEQAKEIAVVAYFVKCIAK